METQLDKDTVVTHAETLVRLQQSEQLTDVTIKYGTRSKKAHKVILCAASPFFANALQKPNFKETQTNELELKDGEEDVLEALIDGIYGITPTHDDILAFAAKLFCAADCYDVPQVARLAAQIFSAQADVQFSEGISEGFLRALEHISSQLDNPACALFDVVASLCSRHMRVLGMDLARVHTGMYHLAAKVALLMDETLFKYECSTQECGYIMSVQLKKDDAQKWMHCIKCGDPAKRSLRR